MEENPMGIVHVIFIVLLVIAHSIVVSGCGRQEATAKPAAAAVVAGPAPSLVGTWTSACIAMDATHAAVVTLTIDATTSRMAIATHRNGSCTALAWTDSIARTYIVGAAVAADVFDLDIVTGAATRTYADERAAATANLLHDLGIGDWKAGAARDVTGMEPFDAAGTPHFQIFRATATALVEGDNSGPHDGATAATRPVRIDESFVFTKAGG